MDDTYMEDAAAFLRKLAAEMEARKHSEATSVVISFYADGQLIGSRGIHKPKSKSK